MLNLRARSAATDDKLFSRVSEPSPYVHRAGSRAILQDHIQTYYQLNGWDEEVRSTRSKWEELSLEDW